MKALPPIFSTRDDDLSMREAIEVFVLALAERIDDLQDAELRGELALIRELCHELCGEASRTGYPALVEVGRTVQEACAARDAEDVRKGIVELTELAQRVRRGSRGAA